MTTTEVILTIHNDHASSIFDYMCPAQCFPSHSKIFIYLGNCTLLFQHIERDIEHVLSYLFVHEFLHLIKEDRHLDSGDSIALLARVSQFELIQREPHYIFTLNSTEVRK